ncbi:MULTISPECIES: phosphate ABC transporter permease PstA [Prosthecochloris]|uniref:Phosphate transport system permease protein PstA n=1 Tax=Prosthecochloris vibrioformis TaxID=1098 RepID=A0A5C4RXR2_PROVB|nr:MULTISPECIES: phosphate ABC transporter permease PstA [Prosthecochloris]ANT64809.1 Phosphate transport system permease protein PstA [Prosthecochloris sp. CIB 2401]TNJ36083.1 phosphate ABC transporter permease PstA [Prosthecochloris vibrioformis]
MNIGTRKLLDRSFTAVGFTSIMLMALALLAVLVPIITGGIKALYFQGTVEHRTLLFNEFQRGDEAKLAVDAERSEAARKPVYEYLAAFDTELESLPFERKRALESEYHHVRDTLHELLGPLPGDTPPLLLRFQYGVTRWEKAEEELHNLLYMTKWDYSDPTKMATQYFAPRVDEFTGTSLEGLFGYVEEHLEEMLLPQPEFYWGFITDRSLDAHIFGGVWAEIQGTFYLAIGAMLFAFPLGVIAAIYFTEYAKDNYLTSMLRSANSTLAGVPSIVFGLFGLAFFINTMKVSESKSVLAGSLTLAIMILPTIIRAAEEAILSVPKTYREASLGLGATKWRTIMTVILPAALPGIITGGIISLGRAAGETAPIIFTAAVSVGATIGIADVFTEPTPALSWNIYNLASEHEAANEIRHVQYGMVMALISIVLLLNISAILLRARISQKLKG